MGGRNTQGVTLVTPMELGRRRAYKYFTLRWVLRYSSFYSAIRRFHKRKERGAGPAQFLEALNFIHFARWVVVTKSALLPWKMKKQGLPRFEQQPREVIGYGVMLFTSNFDNNWPPYVDTFMDAAEDELGAFWNDIPGWSDPTKAGYESFFGFVDSHAVEHDHYYAAFPSLATSDIKAALAVDRSIRSFDKQTRDSLDPDWDHAFGLLVSRLQRSLGTIKRAPDAVDPTAFIQGGMAPFELTSIAPVPLSGIPRLRNAIRSLPTGSSSPFAAIPGTHFARLVLIDSVLVRKERVQLESGYLLMSVDADRSLDDDDDWLSELYDAWSPGTGRASIDTIWGSCFGFGTGRSETDFLAYMNRTSYNAVMPFADYPRSSLWDIHRAIQTQSWFSKFVFENLGDDRRSIDERRSTFESNMDVASITPSVDPP